MTNSARTQLAIFLIAAASCSAVHSAKPDIILMMADDMGFSDLGCYGGEIATPNLNRLARSGVRFSNFSNTSRCCPSRASLLTGLYAHQAGLGGMTGKGEGPGYQGQLRGDIKTLPERFRELGYDTAMVGKWHQTLSNTIDDGPNGSWPWQRGFGRFYGTMEGAKNYFQPKWLFDDTQEVVEFSEDFYYTHAVSERAATWIAQQEKNKPLFLYTAFYAPHFPLQAPQRIIDKYRGKYLQGWDKLRIERFQRQRDLEVIPPGLKGTQLSSRPEDVPAWDTLSQKQRDEMDLRMATYAAQVELLDQGVGRILDALRKTGRLKTALVIFLSDNGAASSGGAFGAGPADKIGRRDAPVHTTYGKGWATLSNTPYRMHKANTHEGGVMAPLIIHSPDHPQLVGKIRRDTAHIIDIAPTCFGAAKGDFETLERPFEGTDLLHGIKGERGALFYEHQKSKAVRLGGWKLVNRGKSSEWELYNLQVDRTEQHNVAAKHPDRVLMLSRLWKDWAIRCNVKAK